MISNRYDAGQYVFNNGSRFDTSGASDAGLGNTEHLRNSAYTRGMRALALAVALLAATPAAAWD